MLALSPDDLRLELAVCVSIIARLLLDMSAILGNLWCLVGLRALCSLGRLLVALWQVAVLRYHL